MQKQLTDAPPSPPSLPHPRCSPHRVWIDCFLRSESNFGNDIYARDHQFAKWNMQNGPLAHSMRCMESSHLPPLFPIPYLLRLAAPQARNDQARLPRSKQCRTCGARCPRTVPEYIDANDLKSGGAEPDGMRGTDKITRLMTRMKGMQHIMKITTSGACCNEKNKIRKR